jgi:hypothetical protein
MEDGVEPGDDGELRIEDGKVALPLALSSIFDLLSSLANAPFASWRFIFELDWGFVLCN